MPSILPDPVAVNGPRTSAETLALLRQRAAVLDRAGPLDLFKACAVLTLSGGSLQDYADALVRTLEQALGRPPQMHLPGTERQSFDEAWLLGLLERSRLRDAGSVAFLICSRVPPQNRESVAFLVEGLTPRGGAYAKG